jgi:hypothetical protein
MPSSRDPMILVMTTQIKQITFPLLCVCAHGHLIASYTAYLWYMNSVIKSSTHEYVNMYPNTDNFTHVCIYTLLHTMRAHTDYYSVQCKHTHTHTHTPTAYMNINWVAKRLCSQINVMFAYDPPPLIARLPLSSSHKR